MGDSVAGALDEEGIEPPRKPGCLPQVGNLSRLRSLMRGRIADGGGRVGKGRHGKVVYGRRLRLGIS